MIRSNVWGVCTAAALLISMAAGCGKEAVPASSAPAVSSAEAASAENSAAESVSTAESAEEAAESTPEGVADPSEMTDVEEVVEEGMIPVYAEDLKDGRYEIYVESSSSMFHVSYCEIEVEDGQMQAIMVMGGHGYQYVYPGTAEEAAAAPEDSRIPYVEHENGSHIFTIPIEALDAPVPCAAFSKKKELWYPRTLLFRSDSLPPDAFADGFLVTPDSLDLSDGEYTAEVTLLGAKGKTAVESPAHLTVEDGECTAEIVWSSPDYDYMAVNGEQYLPVSEDGENAAFRIPIRVFDRPVSVIADSTALGKGQEVRYSLLFDSETVEEE